MTDDELDNKPVSDAEFAEFMRPTSFTHEIPIEEVKWGLGLTEEEADVLLSGPKPLTEKELKELVAEINTPENTMDFEQAFAILLKHEGGYSNHKDDTGGATMWGITEKVARAHSYAGEMRNLPVEFAKRIYKATYWDAVKADELPAAVRYSVFDAAVNSGVNRAARWLQTAVGVKPDGVIGSQTLAAIKQHNPDSLNAKYNGVRLTFMTELSSWSSFGKGWARRVASNLIGV